MTKVKNKRLKLTTLFILGISIILILLTIALIIVSSQRILDVGDFAVKADKENNEKLCSELFLEITQDTAKIFSQAITKTGTIVETLAYMVKENLETKEFRENFNKNPIHLTKYKNRDFFVWENQKKGYVTYWGNPIKVPNNITLEINSLHRLLPIIKSIYNSNPFYEVVWINSSKMYVVGYPYVTSYLTNIKNREVFINYYKKFWALGKKEYLKTNLEYSIGKPYIDISNRIVISAKTPILNKSNKIIAYVGIDINYAKLIKTMSTSQSFLKNNSNLEKQINGFLFSLDKNGNIVNFPPKYIDLFSLPKEKINLKNYLEKITVKLNDSKNLKIKSLSKEIQKSTSGVKVIKLKGKTYLISYSKIDKTGQILCFVIDQNSLLSSVVKTKEKIREVVTKLGINYSWIAVLFLILSFIFLILFFRFFFSKPIRRIRDELKILGDGNFNINLKEEGTSEMAELSYSINSLGKKLRDYMENLKYEVAARQSIETEIHLAEKIQRSILPDTASFPTHNYFQLAARLNAAKNVSGDFYDFFYLDENKIAIVIADVSGKGLQAAFFMAMSKILIKNQCVYEPNDPAKVLQKVNKALCMDNKAQMFVTVHLIFYNIKDGRAKYANAGHHEGIMLKGNNIIRAENLKNIALGIFNEAEYKTGTAIVNPGDIGIFYTDGIPEAISPEEEEYGEERLEKLVLKNKDLPLNNLCDTIIEDVTVFEGKNRFDDITMIAIKRCK
jgi:serine phosphatase RsbU (regulator of sigma subunit)